MARRRRSSRRALSIASSAGPEIRRHARDSKEMCIKQRAQQRSLPFLVHAALRDCLHS